MSGGSMDYLYSRVEDASFALNSPARRAFKKKLALVAKCLRAIEWNDSGDGCTREADFLAEFLGPNADLTQLVAEAKEAYAALERAISAAGTAGR